VRKIKKKQLQKKLFYKYPLKSKHFNKIFFEKATFNHFYRVKFHHVVNGITPPSFAKGA
jgi:hypothetical protein